MVGGGLMPQRFAARVRRDNGVAFGKGKLYHQEMDLLAPEVSADSKKRFKRAFPDTFLTGSTSLFVVNMELIEPPATFRTRANEILR